MTRPVELDTVDWYKASFESTVSEYEGLWLKNGVYHDKQDFTRRQKV